MSPFRAFSSTVRFWQALYLYLWREQHYSEVTVFEEDLQAKSFVYSYALTFLLFDEKHYRSSSFQQDLRNNLSNVAIPGTGVPLSVFCIHYYVTLFYVLFCVPFICFCAALRSAWKRGSSSPITFVSDVSDSYVEYLLHPSDWFSLWRLNCSLTSLHSHEGRGNSLIDNEYMMEDKWTFLQQGKALGVPVSPYLDIDAIVIKNKNMEGGLGINFYQNALFGGDFIIQKRLKNAEWLRKLLPENAPLSTLRLITASSYALQVLEEGKEKVDKKGWREYIGVLSGVIRLGREDASTDHASVLFDVDITTGVIGEGRSNSQWYDLSPTVLFSGSWDAPPPMSRHPDVHKGDSEVTGKKIPDIKEAVDIVTWSHHMLMKNVPLVGWDVAFTADGICLLEVNLSCNFFMGTFDKENYFSFVDKYWENLRFKKTVHTKSE